MPRYTISDCTRRARLAGLSLTNNDEGDLVLTAPANKRFESNLSHESVLVSQANGTNCNSYYEQIGEVIAGGFTPCLVSDCCGNE